MKKNQTKIVKSCGGIKIFNIIICKANALVFCFGDLGHISRTPWSLLVLQFGQNQRSMTGKTSWSFIMFKSGCARIRVKTLY